MSRKHYIAVAAAINEVYRECGGSEGKPEAFAVLEVMSRIAKVFAADNPRFDTQRFYAACQRVPCSAKCQH